MLQENTQVQGVGLVVSLQVGNPGTGQDLDSPTALPHLQEKKKAKSPGQAGPMAGKCTAC